MAAAALSGRPAAWPLPFFQAAEVAAAGWRAVFRSRAAPQVGLELLLLGVGERSRLPRRAHLVDIGGCQGLAGRCGASLGSPPSFSGSMSTAELQPASASAAAASSTTARIRRAFDIFGRQVQQCTTRAVSVRMASNRFMPLICTKQKTKVPKPGAPGRNRVQDKVASKDKHCRPMPPKAGTVDVEQFSRNIARMVEEGGKALAAYLKPREEGAVKAEPADEIADVVKTLGHVAEYWLSDPQRAVEVQACARQGLSGTVGRGGQTHGGRAGAAGGRARSARQALRRPRMVVEPVLRLPQAGLSADHAMGRPAGAERRRRCAHAAQGGVLRAADRQRGRALELRAHQSGTDARDAVVERARTSCAACTCWPRTSRPARAT